MLNLALAMDLFCFSMTSYFKGLGAGIQSNDTVPTSLQGQARVLISFISNSLVVIDSLGIVQTHFLQRFMQRSVSTAAAVNAAVTNAGQTKTNQFTHRHQ
jgi:hypothetical protein